jgi:hypothetical protein
VDSVLRRLPDKNIHSIIDSILDKPPVETKSYRGISWSSDKMLSKALGKANGTVNVALNRYPDLTHENIIDSTLKRILPLNRLYNMLPTKYKIGDQYDSIMHYYSDNPAFLENYISEGKVVQRLKEELNQYRGIRWTSIRNLENNLGRSRNYVSLCSKRHGFSCLEQVVDFVLRNRLPIEVLYSMLPSSNQTEDHYESVMQFAEIHPEILEPYIKEGRLMR